MKSLICTVFLTLLTSLSFASEIKLTDGGSTTDTAGNVISCKAEKKSYCICQFTQAEGWSRYYYALTLVDTLNQKSLISDGTVNIDPCLKELQTRPECK